MKSILPGLRFRIAAHYGPHYGVAAQGVLRGTGFLYVLAFWSLASQVMGLSGPTGLLPAGSFQAFLTQRHGFLAPWLYPSLAWIASNPAGPLALCGVGVVAGLGLMYGFFPWVSGFAGWLCWISLIQLCQPWLNLPGDLLLAEAGFLVLFLVPARSRRMPPVEDLSSRLTGILLLNLLLVQVLFTSGMARLDSGGASWREATALFSFFETQPLPTVPAWYAHHLPAAALKYLLWGWMFIELMLPWYTFLPRMFRNMFAGAVGMYSLVLLTTGQHGWTPLICMVLSLSLVDDVSWRRILPESWGPAASLRQYRPGWAGVTASIILGPMLLYQTVRAGGAAFPPWSWMENLLGHVWVTPYSPGDTRVPETRREISLQASNDGQQWVEYRFWLKPSDPRSLSTLGMPHVPRLDLAMMELARSRELEPGVLPGWTLRLVGGLLAGDPAVNSLFPVNPFPDAPPRYVRLVAYQARFADPVTRRDENVWWERRWTAPLGPVFSRQEGD